MKIFQNKSIFKKLIIVLLVVMLFSFCMPKSVRAEDGIGGKLLNPIMSFFVSLGDGAMTLLQKVVLQIDESLVPVDTSSSFWAKFLVIVAAIVVCSVILVATVLTAGAAAGVALAVAAALKGAAAIAITIGVTTITFPVTTQVVEGMLPNNFQLPMFVVTPQEIFSNKIPLLDVDFFNPSESMVVTKKKLVDSNLSQNSSAIIEAKKHGFTDDIGYTTEDSMDYQGNKVGTVDIYNWSDDNDNYILQIYHNDVGADAAKILKNPVSGATNPEDYVIWSTDNLTDGGTDTSELEYEYEDEEVEIKSTAAELRSTVSNWYVILRDIALVALLSVLVYIGIRILISSTSQDKAKYKQMLVDWIVAICLLFVMQYIMSFSNVIVKKIIEIVDTTQVSADEKNEIIEPEAFLITDKEKVSKAYEVLIGNEGDSTNPYYQYFTDGDGNPAGSQSTVLLWPAENFMQQARLKLQLLEDDEDTYVAIGWKLIYIVLVIFTLIFIFTYVKRVIYMAFLTIIAPLVALTYPIDKINDGKSQAFNMWFKEYIFNLLLQPMHLILYTILIGSAMDFASQNIIYVVVALGFMIPAEKMLRSFFGFEKAKTPGLLAGPAGAAIMMTGMNKLLGKKSNSKSSLNESSSNKAVDKSDDNSNLRFNKGFDKANAMLSGVGSNVSKDNKERQTRQEQLEQEETKQRSQSLNESQISEMNEAKKASSLDDLNKKKKLKEKFAETKAGRGFKAATRAGRYYGHKKLEKVGKKIQNSHPLRTGLKLYGGLAGATAGTILGGVSGDPTKAAQYAMTGAMGSYKAMDGVLPDFSSDEGWNSAIEMGKQDYLGDEIDDYNMEKYIKNFQKNYDNQITLEKALGSKKAAKEFLEYDAGGYIKNGVTDIEDMIAINKLEKNGTVSSRDMGIATFKYAKRVGSKPKDMKQKDKDEWHNTFVKEFKNNPYIKNSNLNVDDEVDKVMNRINAFYDVRK